MSRLYCIRDQHAHRVNPVLLCRPVVVFPTVHSKACGARIVKQARKFEIPEQDTVALKLANVFFVLEVCFAKLKSIAARLLPVCGIFS